MQELIDKNLGKYHIIAQLGRGGMAEVYKAYQANLDRYVAIKVMHAHLAEDPDFVKRFEREAKNVAALRHPNIVQVFDFDLEGELSYMVMEFIDGGTLKTHLENLVRSGERLPLSESTRIVIEIGQALTYAHAHNMIHRDVKPANVMVNSENRIILTDFGLAKILTGPRLTLTGAAVGTPAYMAPEQGLGDAGDPRADIYSLGVILYELTTGQLPFEADTPLAIMLKHMSEPVPPPRTFQADLPDSIEAIILKSLAKKPEDRFQSVNEMLAQLQIPFAEMQTQPGKEAPPQPAPTVPVQFLAQVVVPPPEPEVQSLPADFVGREPELAAFGERLSKDHLVIISGMPGVGKTSLAAALAARLSEPSRLFWHAFHAGEGVSALIWKLAAFLAWRGQPGLWQMMTGAQGMTGQPANPLPPPEVLFDYLFPMLCNQRLLLCLDNFEQVEGDPLLAQFMERLEKSTGKGELDLILVSAQRLPGLPRSETFEPLKGLSLSNTRRLLSQRAITLPDDLAEKLYERTGGNAQVLILAIDALKRAQDPARLLDNLSQSENIESYLIKTIDEGLADEERETMEAIAILSGYPGSRDAISTLLDGRSLRLTLNELSGRYLVTVSEGGNGKEYNLNALVQAFYYDALSKRQRQALHRQAGEFYAAEEPDALRATLHFQRAGEDGRAIALATGDVWSILNRGGAIALQGLLEKFSDGSRDPIQQASLNLARGQVYAFLGEPKKAQASYEAVILLEIPSPPGRGAGARDLLQARACLGMGEMLQTDLPYKALEWLQRGLQSLAESDAIPEKSALSIRMGRIHAYLGDLAAAEGELQHGLEELPVGPSRLHITALGNLGNIACIRGDLTQGKDYYQRAMDIAGQMHDFWSMNEARHNLGYELDIAGDWAEALKYYQEELVQAEKFGSLEQRLRARLHLGNLYIKMGNYPAGQAHLYDCIELARQAHPRYRIYAQSSLADLYLRQGLPEDAVPLLVEAERMVKATGGGQAEALPEIYRTHALAHLDQGNLDEALGYANLALEQARGAQSNVDEGIGLRVLGQVQVANGKMQEALASFEQSLKLLENRDPYEAARTQMTWGECLLYGAESQKGERLLREAKAVLQRLGAKEELDAMKKLSTD